MGLVAVVALVVGACAGADAPTSSPASSATARLPTPVQELTFDASEYTFTISPDPSAGLQAGWTLVRFRNVGAEAHQVMFAAIKDGVDLSQLAAAGAGDSSGAGAIEFVDMIGGVSYIDPAHETTALVDLRPGLVMAMCYVPDANGVAHALMGMTSALTVAAPSVTTTSTDTEPVGDEVLGTIELSGDGYQIPADLRAGWYRVANTDTVLHEMSLLRVSRPISAEQAAVLVDDLAANRTPQVGLDAVGGMGAVSAGFDGFVHLDLPAGDYVAVDFMPDPGDPRPHMLDGYYRTFRVS